MDPVSLNVLIRTDAKKEVALGHLKRCVVLASDLKERGVFVSFLTAKDDYTERFLHELDFEHTALNAETNSEEDCEKTLKIAKSIYAQMIIIDSYEIDNNYRKRLIDSGYFVVSITDTAFMDLLSHVIVNSNFNAEKCEHGAPNGTILLLGIEYLLLERIFSCRAGVCNIERIGNVLITMGGIDHYDLTSKILEVLDGFEFNFDITAIVGPYYENIDSIKAQIGLMQKKVNLINSPSSLYSYMESCSLAFCAGGGTLYELAVLGRPIIGISLCEHQGGNVNELSKVGMIKGLSYSNDNFGELLVRYTTELIQSESERRRISKIASSVVDGRGAERVCNKILDAYNEWTTTH